LDRYFAFRHDTYIISQLKLKGAHKKDWNGWISQVYSFYARVEQEGLPMMKKQWVSNYKKVARVALQDDPQLLEVLGITVPSVQ
jgi:hypothetical protein